MSELMVEKSTWKKKKEEIKREKKEKMAKERKECTLRLAKRTE